MCITLQVMLPFVEELALIYLFIFHQFDCTFDFFELLSTDEFLIKQKKKTKPERFILSIHKVYI
jgi:hypothetical protein